MATSPITQSATKSGAAKDDVLGVDSDFNFTIADLLANDPGGAAKVNTATQFFFGDTAQDQADQAGYMAKYGITANDDGSYTVKAGSDFNYFVQIGNKGTWSTAHVDVMAQPEAHAGDLLFREDFESYSNVQLSDANGGWEAVDLSTGGWNTNGGAATEVVHTGYLGLVNSTSGQYWLDTQATTGGVQLSHEFNDPTGGQVQLSFDIGTEDLRTTGNGTTDPDAAFEFRIDGQLVKTITVQDILAVTDGHWNEMAHFDILADVGAAGTHTLELVDVTANDSNFGFSLDSIAIHDWIV